MPYQGLGNFSSHNMTAQESPKELRQKLYAQWVKRHARDFCPWCILPGELVRLNPRLLR